MESHAYTKIDKVLWLTICKCISCSELCNGLMPNLIAKLHMYQLLLSTMDWFN